MPALTPPSRVRVFSRALLIFFAIVSLTRAQNNPLINGVNNPNIGVTTQTLNQTDAFTGSLTVGTVGQNFGTLSLAANYTSLLPIVLTGNQSALSNSGGLFTLTLASTGSLTRTDPGVGTYSQVFTKLNNAGNIVVNQGTLFVNGDVTSSGTITVSAGAAFTQGGATSFTNSGTAKVTGAGSVLTVLNVANTGTITANLAGDVQFAGNFTTASLGTVDVSNGGIAEILGNLTNTGTTLTAPTGGAFTLTGTITGGNIVDTALIEKSGALDGATVQGNITVDGGASPETLILRNGAGFTGTMTVGTPGQNTGTFYLGSNLSLNPSTTLVLTGNNSQVSWSGTPQPTLTVPATSTILRTGTGSTQFQDHLINQGTVTVNGGQLLAQDIANSSNITVAAGTSLSSATGITQTAGTLKVDGTLFPSTNPGLVVQGGSLTGAGNIQGTTTLSGGTLDPGSTIGTLTFTGNLTLMGGATTLMELGAGANLNDKVVVTSGNTLVFGGALNLVTVSTVFVSGQTWNLFGFTAHSGSFASFTLPNTNNGWIWDTSQLTTTGVLTLTTFVPLPVPEPSTYALLAAGLGVMFVAHRRRVR